jgi:pimeloyl-ACP methyl ester carboxylesterase
MTAELHELLAKARIEPPYVLAGASLGGMNAQLFASTHPEEVDGVVLVDSLHPDLDRRIEPLLGRRGARLRREQLARNPENVTYADLLTGDDVVRAARGRFPPVPLIALEHGLLRPRRRARPQDRALVGRAAARQRPPQPARARPRRPAQPPPGRRGPAGAGREGDPRGVEAAR